MQQAAESSGLRTGDVITAWAFEGPDSASVEARLCSPFTLMQIPIERARRGTVTLSGRRGDEPWRLEVSAGLEGLRVGSCAEAPALPETAAWEQLQLARAQSEARDWTEADKGFGAALEHLGPDARPAWRAQVLRAWGDSLDIRNDGVNADRRYQEALAEDQRGGPGLPAAWDRHRLGMLARERGDLDAAEAHFREALALRQRLAPGSLDEAATLCEMGAVEHNRGRMDRADAVLRPALALQTALAPDGLEVARSLYLLGISYLERDLRESEQFHLRSMAIRERLAPRSLDMADSLNALAVITGIRGDVRGATERLRRVLELRQALRPGDPRNDTVLGNLAKAAEVMGDFVKAEDYGRRALAGAERQNPRSPRVALLRHNLGIVALARGDLDAAEAELRRALEISEALAARGTDTRTALRSLSLVALARNDAAAALELLRRAVDIDAEQMPGGIGMASDLVLLSSAKRRLRDLDGAEADAREALRIIDTQSPQSFDTADILLALGGISMDRGAAAKAAELYAGALAIHERVAPGSAYEAESRHELGQAYARMAQGPKALEAYCAALDSLETQGARLGGTESARVSFGAKYAGYYHDCLAALVRAGRPQEAVRVLERSRARSLLALLAERDLVFRADLPPELAEERRMADVEYDRIQRGLMRLNPKTDEAKIAGLLGRQREVRARQEDIAARARKASPRFASVQYPSPLDLPAVRAALDPGTILLAYSVGAEETLLLAIASAADAGAGLRVETLPIGERTLREKIEVFRQAIQPATATPETSLMEQAAELYDLLVAPVETQVAASARVVLLPDGPLHSLPFAALVRRPRGAGEARAGAGTFFVEWRPLHTVPSATVYAELNKTRRPSSATADGQLVAFGDPRYPPLATGRIGTVADPGVRDVVRSFSLTPLPSSREEVDGIARLFPARAQKYFGAEATEGRAKALDGSARYVHFACHGYLDQRFPLNSALALTIPTAPAEGEDNGLLQAWEIFDTVRVDADMVALSACDTALGKEMGGEGLLGLTRAFLYAGARSVLGTLWGVADNASAVLMERFYRHLQHGKSRDAALQAAQVDFIRGNVVVRGRTKGDLAHPFRWAAYQLTGDWR